VKSSIDITKLRASNTKNSTPNVYEHTLLAFLSKNKYVSLSMDSGSSEKHRNMIIHLHLQNLSMAPSWGFLMQKGPKISFTPSR